MLQKVKQPKFPQQEKQMYSFDISEAEIWTLTLFKQNHGIRYLFMIPY